MPPGAHEFKKRFLECGQAVIIVFYENGKVEERPWQRVTFSKSSNVMGNLRSRPEFRQGEWQRLGIKYVRVRVGA